MAAPLVNRASSRAGKRLSRLPMLIDLGISIAMGGHFLGRLKVNRAARVGIMSGESGLATIQETARRIAAAAGYRLSDIGGLVFSDQLPQFNSVAHLAAMRRFCMDDELEVIAIDPAYLCVGEADHGNLFAMGERLQGISRVCEECGVTYSPITIGKRARPTRFPRPNWKILLGQASKSLRGSGYLSDGGSDTNRAPGNIACGCLRAVRRGIAGYGR